MRLSNIIQKPIVSEKSFALAPENRFSFRVDRKATKGAISKAVKAMFGVDAVDIKTAIIPGKRKRAGKTRKFIRTASWKKAVVKIKEGQKIDLFESLIGGKK